MECLDPLHIAWIVDFARGIVKAPPEDVLSHVLSCDKCMLVVMEIDEILTMGPADDN